MHRLAAFSLLVSLSVGGYQSTGANPDPLDKFVENFAGASVQNCGSHDTFASREALEGSVACGRKASVTKTAFVTRQHIPGIDSTIYQGLVGRADGTVYFFWYDSAPCGGPGCYPRFSVQRRVTPIVVSYGMSQLTFGCQ
jgi:hypothetical protein